MCACCARRVGVVILIAPTLIFLASAGLPQEHAGSPAEAVAWAAWDIQTLPASDHFRQRIRYLSLYNIPEPDLAATHAWVDYVLNTLNGSHNRVLTRTAVVPFTGGRLLRVDLQAYSGDDDSKDPRDLDHFAAAWDRLAFVGSGPVVSIKRAADKEFRAGEPYFSLVVRQNGKLRTIAAPWVDQASILFLQAETQTAFPILRADWFASYALLAPAYYDFLRIDSIEDIRAITVLDRRADFLATQAAVVRSREVALHNRMLLRTPTAAGSYWETFDYLTSIGPDDALDNLLSRRRDASEVIVTMPNGLLAFGLFDGQDKRLDVPNPSIAIAMDTPWEDKQVWNAYACITCHDQGFKPIRDTVRPNLRPPGGLLFNRDNRKEFSRITQLFASPIEASVNRDVAGYADAVLRASGFARAGDNARNVEKLFLRYYQDEITLETAAAETGRTPEILRGLLGRAIGTRHEGYQLFMGDTLRRDQFEARGFRDLMLLESGRAAK